LLPFIAGTLREAPFHLSAPIVSVYSNSSMIQRLNNMSTVKPETPQVVVSAGTAGSAASPGAQGYMQTVTASIILNIVSSVALVSVNKWLVNYGFTYILLLTACHFLTGFVFLHLVSSPSFSRPLFTRPQPLPWQTSLPIAAAGIGSIALMNYSLRFNSVGTYQILKVAILPGTMILSHLQGIATPTRKEVMAAALVVIGALIFTASDVKITAFGILVGFAAVFATAQYQIWQGTVQSQNGITSTQAMYAISVPQAAMTFAASLLVETSWEARFGSGVDALGEKLQVNDLWAHPYQSKEIVVILLTCALAVLLNYSTISVIGKVRANEFIPTQSSP
jgi:hypothetical protein